VSALTSLNPDRPTVEDLVLYPLSYASGIVLNAVGASGEMTCDEFLAFTSGRRASKRF
jgi:hypothetical protein